MKIAVIGECMIELSKQSNNEYAVSYGGDTLNTAIYLARCGGQSDYFTVIGNDAFSQSMLKNWQQEGVGTSSVKYNDNALPGLYLIENDGDGERTFHYWRDSSPAKTLFEDFPETYTELIEYDIIFLSGITLSIYTQQSRHKLYSFLKNYRKQGGKVIFDNNYREKNWTNSDSAIENFDKIMLLVDTALISFDDELLMRGDHSVETCIARWTTAGVTELVVKNGAQGCMLSLQEKVSHIPLQKVLTPVDTTAAGDSFNGAYLAAKLQGMTPPQAILQAQRCASVVISHQGAIIDKALFIEGMENMHR